MISHICAPCVQPNLVGFPVPKRGHPPTKSTALLLQQEKGYTRLPLELCANAAGGTKLRPHTAQEGA